MKNPAVYVIGTGPGDPGLITAHGLECLSRADVVIHDHEVPVRLLKQAREGAELIDVGSAVRQPMAQDAITFLLAEKARDGKLVARLKQGDPFVFDRGGEEALFLHEQGIPFEVVPGIPLGIGVPAYAGVPVTYPGGGDTITLVRGHEDESRAPLPDVDWTSLAKLDGTVVCYAGSQQLPRILQALVSNGWPEDGHAVIVYNGTLARQETTAGTIGELVAHVREQHRKEPAILVVGRVAAFREHLRWFDTRPLFGTRVLVTRPRDQAAEMVDQLAKMGAETIEAPMIRIVPPEDLGPLRDAAAHVRDFDWIVFSSANSVESFMSVLLEGDRDVRSLTGPGLCVVGTGTAERLGRYGIKADLVPAEFRGEAVVAALTRNGSLDGVRVLIPRADIGRDVIVEGLRHGGAQVTDVVAYRTVLEDAQQDDGPDVYRMLLDDAIDVVTFTSPSAVRNFAAIYGKEQTIDLLAHTDVAVIGPVTAEAATHLGLTVTIQPATSTIPALVDAITEHVAARRRARSQDTTTEPS
jgi:uroporphyrinogen III methyltransferase/synthase